MIPKPIEQFRPQLTLKPVLKPIISINPYPSIILNKFIIHRQSIAEMKDIMATDKNNIYKETDFVKLVTFPFLIFTLMPSSTFTSIPFCYIPETFPTTIADNDPILHSSIPHYHIKHPKWYFDDADLFFSQRGVLFGLHQHKFNNPYFSRRLKHIEPCKTAAIGTKSSLPIPIDTLSISTFTAFIRLLYQPDDFSTDITGWNHIKDLAMTWGFVDITLLAMQKIKTTGSIRRSTL